MFTGIVEIVGKVHERVNTSDNNVKMKIGNARGVTEDVHLGDSIAINGTCLTVTEFDDDWFKVGLAPETLRRTNLGN